MAGIAFTFVPMRIIDIIQNMKLLHIIIFLFSIKSTYAKRPASNDLDPLPYRKGTIQQIVTRNDEGMSVSILARDKAGDIRWNTKIYQVIYKRNMETDVQDVHLKKIYLKEKEVVAIDELGKAYHLDLSDGVIQN